MQLAGERQVAICEARSRIGEDARPALWERSKGVGEPTEAKPTELPKSPWQGALLCANPFALKEARAAVTAGDRSWLQKTQAVGGLRVVLIDAPFGPSSLSSLSAPLD